jgi:hypothetical protein
MTDSQASQRLTESQFVGRLDELVEAAERDGVVVERCWTCRSTVEGVVWDVEFVRTRSQSEGGADDD